MAAMPLSTSVAAVSVGVVLEETLLDLCYEEDLHADVDFNVVVTGEGDFVEVQGTAEGAPFSATRLDAILTMAKSGIQALNREQQAAVEALTIA